MKIPKLTTRQIRRALMMGTLEFAANREYESKRFHPERGGPALARLNAFRKDKRRTTPKADR